MTALSQIRVQLQEALAKQDRQLIQKLYNHCPSIGNKEMAAAFLDMEMPYWNMVSLHTLAMSYFFGKDYSFAFLFADLGFQTCTELVRTGQLTRHPDILQYMGEMAGYQIGCHLYAGNLEEGLAVHAALLPRCRPYVSNRYFPGFRLYQIDLLLGANKMDDAFTAMQQINEAVQSGREDAIFPPSWQIEYERLRKKIEALIISIINLAGTKVAASDPADVSNDISQLANRFAGLISEETISELQKMAATTRTANPNDVAAINEDYDRMLQLQETISGVRLREDALEKIKSRIQKLGAMLQHPTKGHEAKSLKAGVLESDELQRLLNNRDKEDVMTLLWIKAICLKRLDLPDASYRVLSELRQLLEARRKTIANPEQRAGVFKAFNWLYHVSAEVTFASGQYTELLYCIEAAKGRSLADNMAVQQKSFAEYVDFNLPVGQLASRLRQASAHYLSFFVDEEWTFAVLLTNDGQVMAQKVPLGTRQINTSDDALDPKQWQGRSAGFFAKKLNPPATLAPLVQILEQAEADGKIKTSDHICYCPDDVLHLYPLHYLKYGEGYLIERFTVSKVHQVHQLFGFAEKEHYGTVACLVAPQAGDTAAVKEGFKNTAKWLQQNLPPRYQMMVETATPAATTKALEQCDVVHFSTHGFFPQLGVENAETDNPYFNSGLLISNGTDLPQLQVGKNYTVSPFLLSPYKLTKDWVMNRRQGHVSLQACVSGRSKKGYGGDALGMEWAFFYCNRSSVVAAAWNVDLDYANAFFSMFYHHWLVQNTSKAKAHQLATLHLMLQALPNDIPAPYYWGAFTLSGNWL